MNIQQLETVLDSYIANGIQDAVMIWGGPGIGKTAIVEQIAAKYGYRCVNLKLSHLLPQDLRGIPYVEDGIAKWAPSEFLPQEQDQKTILFLDEINMAPKAIQAAAHELILERRIGEYRLPEQTVVWAAGNRSGDFAAVERMTAPLANRFNHYTIEADLDSFIEWGLPRISEVILGFLKFRPEALYKLDPQASAFPTPRSWERASRLYAAGLGIAPAVGDATDVQFRAYVEVIRDLPDIDGIYQGKAVPFPATPQLQYATLMAVAARIKQTMDIVNSIKWGSTIPSEFTNVLLTLLKPIYTDPKHFASVTRELVKSGDMTAVVKQFTAYTDMMK